MQKTIIYQLTGALFLITALYLGYLIYPNLDKGLIMNDEAYYLMHFRDYKEMITIDSTNYFRIFQLFYTDNIHHFRIITYVFLNLSSYLLFFLAAKWFKISINPFLFGLLGLCLNFLTWPPSNIVLNQYHGNTILMNLVLSSVMAYLLWHQRTLLVAAGFFSGIMLFNGIPHTLALGPVVFFLLYNYWRKNKLVIFLFFAGILIAILYYFTFIQSISHFISQLEYLNIYKQFHRKQHPVRFYLYWIGYVVGWLILPLSLSIFFIQKFIRNKKFVLDRILIVLAVVAVIISFFSSNIYVKYYLGGLLFYRFVLTQDNMLKKGFTAMLMLIPFGLAFGSGFYFHMRGNLYQIYLFLAISLIILTVFPFKYFGIYLAFFAWPVLNFHNYLYEKGWKDFVFAEQNSPVEINGHTLYLDVKRKIDLDHLRPYLRNQPDVIYSKNNLAGYLYILNAKAPVPYYFTLKDYIKYMMDRQKKSPDDFIYIESDEHPFSVTDLHPMEFVQNPAKFRKIQTGRFTLFLPENYHPR